jgi:UDP-glucose 4-epimerase
MLERPDGPVVVVGVRGGLGRAVARRLRTRGRSVVGIARRTSPGVDAVADLTDRRALAALLADVRPSAVVVAAGVTPGECDTDPDAARRVTVDAVLDLYDAADAAGCRTLVVPSSSAVYGDARRTPADESAPPAPGSRYAELKLAAEEGVAARLAAGGGVRPVALRIFNVWGPGFRRSLVTRLLASTPGAPVALAGLDSFVRDYVHGDDVAALVAAVIESGDELPGVVNVGSGAAVSNRRLVAALGARHELHWVEGEPLASWSCADVSLARRVLGFAPRGVADAVSADAR